MLRSVIFRFHWPLVLAKLCLSCCGINLLQKDSSQQFKLNAYIIQSFQVET